MKKIIIAILLVMTLVCAGSFENGMNALRNGNYQEAVKWFKKAANQGVAQAQSNLGAMYDKGEGVRPDESKAKALFGQACDNGLQNGCEGCRELNEEGVK